MDSELTIDRYVIETLMRDLVAHDHRPSAFLVYLALSARADAGGPPPSHARLAEETGLSKRSVQDAIRHLSKRGLLVVKRQGATEPVALQVLAPWRDRST